MQMEGRNLNQMDAVKINAGQPELGVVEKEQETSSHGLIGLALTLGFVLMFLVDHLGNAIYCRACARPLFSAFQCVCCQRRPNDLLLRKLLLLKFNYLSNFF